MRRLPLLALVLLAAGCGRHDPFGYDRHAPLALRDRGVVNPSYPVKVHDVTYAGAHGRRVSAFLVVPPGKGPFAGAIYLHGSGQDRLALLVPATWLAARGVVSLVVDSPAARGTGIRLSPGAQGLREEAAIVADGIVDLRRGVDLLASLSSVDRHRIGFVGLSAGARIGAILAGTEHRIRAYDLMSGGSVPMSRVLAETPSAYRRELERDLGPLDPMRDVAHAAPSRLLFQDGLQDEIVTRKQLENLYRAASNPKEIRWYAAGHLLDERAMHDQLAWLSREFDATGPAVPGARTGP